MSQDKSATEYDLECQSINKDFAGFKAVDDVSFGVPTGTFFFHSWAPGAVKQPCCA